MTLIRGKEHAAPLIQSFAYGETSMGTAVLTNRLNLDSVADTTLKAAVRFWFIRYLEEGHSRGKVVIKLE